MIFWLFRASFESCRKNQHLGQLGHVFHQLRQLWCSKRAISRLVWPCKHLRRLLAVCKSN